MPYYPALIGITTSPRLDQTAAFAFTGLGNTTLLNTSTLFTGLGGSAPAVGVPGYSFVGGTQLGLRRSSTTGVVGVAGGTDVFSWTVIGLQLAAANSFSWSATATPNGGSDLFLTRAGAAAIQVGAANAASPVAQTLQAQGSRSGTDTNVAGPNFTIAAPLGTGNSAAAKLLLNSPVAVASGTGAQISTTGLAINIGTAVLTNYTVANLPAAATAGAGALAFVTDATLTTITGLGLAVIGGGGNKVVVYSDATNWIII